MGTDNLLLGRRYLTDLWSKGHFNVITEIVSPNLVVHDPLLKEVKGLEGLKSQIKDMRIAFPDLSFTVEDVFGADNRVVICWSARGTHRGPLAGIAATGRSGLVRGIDLFRIESGKIVEVTAHWDAYGMLQQLGLVPSLDQLSQATSTPQPSTRP